MGKGKECWLIENNSQTTHVFPSITALKKWAKERGYKIYPSPSNDLLEIPTFYTESYWTLPTDYSD